MPWYASTPPRQLGQSTPNNDVGNNIVFLPIFLIFTLQYMPTLLDIYCTFLVIISAYGGTSPRSHTGVPPLNSAPITILPPEGWPSLYNLAPRIDAYDAHAQVQNTSPASGSMFSSSKQSATWQLAIDRCRRRNVTVQCTPKCVELFSRANGSATPQRR